MTFDVGVNFRYSTAYVTDPAGTTYCDVFGNSYPQTRGGITFGWTTSGVQFRDRSSTYDARIAGVNFATDTTGSPSKFRIDLPSSGATNIYCAMGDPGNGPNAYLQVFDNTTSLGTLIADKSAPSNFYDSTDTGYSAANWPSSNTSATKTFTGTIAVFQISPGTTSASKNYAIAHIRVAQTSGGGGGVVIPVFVHHYQNQGIM